MIFLNDLLDYLFDEFTLHEPYILAKEPIKINNLTEENKKVIYIRTINDLYYWLECKKKDESNFPSNYAPLRNPEIFCLPGISEEQFFEYLDKHSEFINELRNKCCSN